MAGSIPGKPSDLRGTCRSLDHWAKNVWSGQCRRSLDYIGFAPTHTVRITGSGKLRAFELDTDDTSISVSGSGDCEVTAQQNLDVNISGSGNVYYKGQPGINADISGSGRLINSN